MATAKEISDAATTRAINVYTDITNGKYSPKELREKYGVGYTRIRQLYTKGERLCRPTHHWTYGILLDQELIRLEPLKSFLVELSTWKT
jgi:hypothetical protein